MTYFPFLTAFQEALTEQKLVHLILLWGSLDDQSCWGSGRTLREGPLACPPVLSLLNSSFVSTWMLVKDLEVYECVSVSCCICGSGGVAYLPTVLGLSRILPVYPGVQIFLWFSSWVTECDPTHLHDVRYIEVAYLNTESSGITNGNLIGNASVASLLLVDLSHHIEIRKHKPKVWKINSPLSNEWTPED